MWYSFLYIPGTMFLDLSQKKFVYKPKTLQILCILCSTSMTHTATIPQGIPAPFCALCFEDQCRKHEKQTSFHLQHVITSKENKLPVLTYLHVYVEMVFCYQNCSDLLREKLF